MSSTVSFDASFVEPSRFDATTRLLLADVDPMVAQIMARQLSGLGFQTHQIATADGVAELDSNVALILLDARKNRSSQNFLHEVQSNYPAIQLVLVSDLTDLPIDKLDVDMLDVNFGELQIRSNDVIRPYDPTQLIDVVNAALSRWKRLQATPTVAQLYLQHIDLESRKAIDRIAQSSNNVFLTGAEGTGKWSLARMLHHTSALSCGSFVAFNCGSLPHQTFREELAKQARVAGSTFFLNEIGVLPLSLQTALVEFSLGLLERAQAGATNLRLVFSSTDSFQALKNGTTPLAPELCQLIEESVQLTLPTLADRKAELPGIIELVLTEVCQRQSVARPTLSTSALDMLCSYHWPNNFCELENVLDRALMRANGPVLEWADFPEHLKQQSSGPSSEHPVYPASKATTPLAGQTLEEIERKAIIETLQACNGNKAKSARMLGISEKSIYNKMRRLEIKFSK